MLIDAKTQVIFMILDANIRNVHNLRDLTCKVNRHLHITNSTSPPTAAASPATKDHVIVHIPHLQRIHGGRSMPLTILFINIVSWWPGLPPHQAWHYLFINSSPKLKRVLPLISQIMRVPICHYIYQLLASSAHPIGPSSFVILSPTRMIEE